MAFLGCPFCDVCVSGSRWWCFRNEQAKIRTLDEELLHTAGFDAGRSTDSEKDKLREQYK
jgi:hypothetical protein